jgi:DNA-binding transcriptional LysR family regulator
MARVRQNSRMNLRQVEVFRAVMSTGSVSDAARLLHVSVPAVSRVLSHTESRLGFALFERVKGRLHPTAEARQLYQEVEQVYAGILRIGTLAHELGQRRYGLVSIVSSPSIGQELVPLAIAQFHAQHPEVHVRFHVQSHELLKEQLLARHVDVGISTLPVDHPGLATRPIARSALVCVCPWTHPLAAAASVTVADLLPYELISYPGDTPLAQRIGRLFAAQGEAPRVSIEVGSPQNACALVHAGAGIALVEEFSLQSWPKAHFRTLQVEGAEPILADLVYLRGAPLTPAADAFVRCLEAVLKERGMQAEAATALHSG